MYQRETKKKSMSWFKSLWSGTTDKEDGEDDDNKKPPASGGLMTSKAPAPPTTEEAEKKLKRAIGHTARTVRDLEKARKTKLREITALKSTNRKAAAKLVPGLQRIDRDIAAATGKLTNLQENMRSMRGIASVAITTDAIKASTQASRAQLTGIGVDEVHEIMDDAGELRDDMDEINEALAEGMGGSSDQARIDEYEADAYLDALELSDESEEAAAAAVRHLPDVPTATVQQRPVKPTTRTVELNF